MLAKIIISEAALSDPASAEVSYLLVVMPKSELLPNEFAGREVLQALLKRRTMKPAELGAEPLAAELGQGGIAAWVMVDFAAPVFERHTAVRKALQLLLAENPRSLDIVAIGDDAQQRQAADIAVYCALVNAPLPTQKKNDDARVLGTITVHGIDNDQSFARTLALAEGNYLARLLTVLPPNELTPAIYRQRIAALAGDNAWQHREFDLPQLKEMGAGAFLAVAQGSAEQDAAIVRVSYRNERATQTVALVGKGICFDTGGHNLKPARGMLGMHEDMNGSAVALAILVAVTRLELPVNIDCWLAIAQNHLSPTAYKQNDVVTALNGTTIEIIHTDAEGRMVLADTLTLAAREKPAMIIDFATLTGSMVTALGTRYSGIFSNRDDLLTRAVAGGKTSGERVSAFPLDADYEVALKSEVADTKQCVIAGEADHILAARFLLKFVDALPWLHMDLSAASCEGGLGAVASQTTGFGVRWGVELLEALISDEE